MIEFLDYVTSPAIFVHLAVLCYILGLLTRKELVLRGFLLLGSMFYILYYFFIADSPLWEAIAASVLIGLANLPVIWRIFRERSTFGMSEEMLTLYEHFPNFNPGQFRKFMAQAEIIRDSDETMLLDEGKESDKLYLTISDGFSVIRGAQHAELPPGNFLGEISFLLGGPATATVIARPGSAYAVWYRAEIEAMMERSSPMANAVTVLLSKDIARKLSRSFPTAARSMLPDNVT